jgi:hypothetical protein
MLSLKIIFCWHFKSHGQKEQDPYSNGMDPSLPSPSLPSPRLDNFTIFLSRVQDTYVTYVFGYESESVIIYPDLDPQDSSINK